MGYRQEKMLEDINGDLIPQYWDVVDQEFKPLTNDPQDVRLTGSNKEFLVERKTEIIAAGAYGSNEIIEFMKVKSVGYIIQVISSASGFNVQVAKRMENPFAFTDSFRIIAENTSGKRYTSEPLYDIAESIQIRLQNVNEQDQEFSWQVIGVVK